MRISLFLVSLLLLSCSKQEDKVILNSIIINPDICQNYIDLSPILEDNVEIIKLETSEDCLISDIDRLEFKEDKIFILDRNGQNMFVFNNKGKYINNIGHRGSGPGEFAYIWDFAFVNNLLYVHDILTHKYTIYNQNGKYVNDLKNIPHHHSILSFDKIVYFVGNYLDPDLGDYNLYKYSISSKKIMTFLPYDKKIREKAMTYGVKSQVAKYKNKALVMYPKDDILYEVDSNTVLPKYKIVFTKYNIPEDMKGLDGFSIFRYARKNNFIVGLEYIQNSLDYLVGYFAHGNRYKYFIYDKNLEKSKNGDMFNISSIGGVFISNFFTNDDNEFVAILDADDFSEMWKSSYNRGNFANEENRMKMEEMYKSTNPGDNPIIIKFKFKSNKK